MGNGSANCGRLLGLARVSALLACVALFAPAAAESKARDRDHDGLSDRYELKKSHTKIRKADSDRDRLKDGYEVRKSKTNPRRADTDRDGLSDFFELRRSHTNPRKRDTDRDGTNDGDEILLGRNPKTPDGPPALNTAPVPPFTVPDLPDPLPDVPDLLPPDTTITTGPAGTVANGTASFSFSSTEANSTFECRLDSSAWTDCDSPQPYAGLADGVHTFSVRATDAAGNTDLTPAQRSWTVAIDHDDTTPPDTSITAGPSGSVTDHSASFSFASTESGSTFQCRLDAGAWGACTSPKAYSGLADGSHTFDVRATDSVGNTDASLASRTWTVTAADTTAPNTTISSGPSGTVSTASASFSFTSSETGSTFQCRLDAGAWGACTSPKAYSGLADGSHTFDVRATDGAGNTDASPASRTWTIDTTPDDTTPPNTTISGGPSGTVTTASASFTFTSTETGSTFQCRLDGGAWGSCTSPKAYSGLADGSHAFNVRATDGAGNVDDSPAARTWTVDTADPTPDPTRTLNCAPTAATTMTNTVSHLCGFADTTNTGVPDGTALRRVPQDVSSGTGWSWANGEITVTGNGAVLDGLYVPGTVTVQASNVTIKNSRLEIGGDGSSWGNWGIALRHAPGTVIENNTISGVEKLGPRRLDNAIRDIYGDSEGFRVVGNEIYWASSCMNHVVAGGLVERNYCHDMGFNTQTGADHTNGLQTEGSTGTLLTLRDNTILVDRDQTDAIMLSGWESQQRNRTLDHNLLAGGGWTLYGMGGANENAVGIRATGNHFSRIFYSGAGYWGPVAYWNSSGTGNVWSGNIWDDTGSAVAAG